MDTEKVAFPCYRSRKTSGAPPAYPNNGHRRVRRFSLPAGKSNDQKLRYAPPAKHLRGPAGSGGQRLRLPASGGHSAANKLPNHSTLPRPSFDKNQVLKVIFDIIPLKSNPVLCPEVFPAPPRFDGATKAAFCDARGPIGPLAPHGQPPGAPASVRVPTRFFSFSTP